MRNTDRDVYSHAKSSTGARVGFHVPISKGLPNAVAYAEGLGCSTMQFFSHNPRSWQHKSFCEEERGEFIKNLEQTDISPLFIHASYLIQLASEKDRIYNSSIRALIEELSIADYLGVPYVIVHAGGFSNENGSSVRRVSDAIEEVLLNHRGKVALLIENTSGGKRIGGDLEEIAEIVHNVQDDRRIGICLDTAHLYQAGYSLSTQKDVMNLVGVLEDSSLCGKIQLLHVNDSLTPRGSKVDRHAHIGEGYIGKRGLKNILHHPLFHSLPFIMETPGIGTDADRENMRRLKELLLSYKEFKM